jgi:hypothetical protein
VKKNINNYDNILLIATAPSRRNFGFPGLGFFVPQNIFCFLIPLPIPQQTRVEGFQRFVTISLSVVAVVRDDAEEPKTLSRVFKDPKFLWS